MTTDRRRCSATYPVPPNAMPYTRIVHCHLEAGHPGDHEEADTGVMWMSREPNVTIRFADGLDDVFATELIERFQEAMRQPNRMTVLPPTEDERERAAYERGKAEGIAEERRERILAAMVGDAPEGVQCRINGGPWAEFAFSAGRHPDDRAGLFGRSPEWSGNAALGAISSDQRLGPVKVEVSLWGVHLVGEAELMELSFGWPGNDGARLIGRSPLRHPDAPTGGSDAS